jgi:MFS family permease
MVPAIIYAEKQSKIKLVFVSAIGMMFAAQLMFAASIQHFWGIVVSLTMYFIAFNVLEASLPSIISKIAPAASKGTAIGVYNTAQSLGIFVGGALGGYLSHVYGFSSVFIFCSIMMFAWLVLAYSMQPPPAVRTKMYSMNEEAPELTGKSATALRNKLAKLHGVIEAVVLPEERTVILKVDKLQDWDDTQVIKLLKG